MEFLGKLGIDWHILIAQIINFVILLIILNKYLYKPALNKIREEESQIKKLIEEKEKFEKEKENINLIQKNEVKEAKQKAQKIIKEAKEIAEEIKQRTTKETNLEKDAIIKQLKNRLKKD